jgi:uncharacterized protein
MFSTSRFIGQISLALAIVISAFLITNCLKKIKCPTKVTVKGCAEKKIFSDFSKWQCEINTIGETQIEAYNKLKADIGLFKNYLSKEGILLDKVDFSPISTIELNQLNDKGHVTNKIESYKLIQEFSISSPDVDLVNKISHNATKLIQDGVNIRSSMPQYFYLNLDSLKITMLGEAANDAFQRAVELVSKSGSTIGALQSAQQGVFQITPAYSSSISDYGEYDTTSIEKRIKAVVTMEYEIRS